MSRVLVTGANGFIGRSVLPILVATGWDVYAVTSTGADELLPGVKWIKGNLLVQTDVSRICEMACATHLLHLAWYTKHGVFWGAEENLSWVVATLNLLEQFQRQGGDSAVITGTCAEYDWSFGYCREYKTPLNPSSVYGISKDALYRLAATYCKLSDIRLVWARLFYLYGPGELAERLVPSIIRALLDNQPAQCNHGYQYRDFLHVQDVAQALSVLLGGRHEGAFNVASSTPVSLDMVARLIADVIGRPDLLRSSHAENTGDVPLLLGSNQKLRATGWKPAISLQDGIKSTVMWWASQQK